MSTHLFFAAWAQPILNSEGSSFFYNNQKKKKKAIKFTLQHE